MHMLLLSEESKVRLLFELQISGDTTVVDICLQNHFLIWLWLIRLWRIIRMQNKFFSHRLLSFF